MTGSYPELAVLAQRVSAPVIAEGEIIAIRQGRPDFGLLQSRMHVRHPPGRHEILLNEMEATQPRKPRSPPDSWHAKP